MTQKPISITTLGFIPYETLGIASIGHLSRGGVAIDSVVSTSSVGTPSFIYDMVTITPVLEMMVHPQVPAPSFHFTAEPRSISSSHSFGNPEPAELIPVEVKVPEAPVIEKLHTVGIVSIKPTSTTGATEFNSSYTTKIYNVINLGGTGSITISRRRSSEEIRKRNNRIIAMALADVEMKQECRL